MAIQAAALTVDVDANTKGAESGLGRIGSLIGSVGSTPFRAIGSIVDFTSKVGFAAIGVSALGSAVGGMAGGLFGMNASLETSTLQFQTLMGDADRAKSHVQDLFAFAGKTPFETGPIIEASRIMQTFGGDALNTMDNLTLFGDAAAATNAPINDIAFWMSRAYAAIQGGQPFGEARMRLMELGVITPQAASKMEDLQKAGASTSEVWAAMSGELTKFSGGMERQANTWSGLTSTFKDSVSLLLAGAMQPLFEMASGGLARLNTFLAGGSIQKAVERIGQSFATALGGAISLITEIITALRSGDWAGAFAVLTTALQSGLDVLLGLGQNIAQKVLESLAGVDWAGVASTILTGLINALSALAGLTWDAATWFLGIITGVDWAGVATAIWNGIKAALFAIVGWGGEALAWIAGVFTSTDWGSLAETIWNGLKAALFALVGWGAEAVGWIQGVFSSIDWSGIATTMRDGITGAAGALDWSSLGQTITNALENVTGEGGGPFEGWVEKVQELWDRLGPFAAFLEGQLQETIEAFRKTWQEVAKEFEGMDLKPVLEALKTLGIILGAVLGAAIAGMVVQLRLFAEFLSVVLPAAAKLLVGTIETLAAIINGLKDVVLNVVAIVRAVLDGDWTAAWNAAKQLVADVVDAWIGILGGAPAAVLSIINDLTGGALAAIGTWVTDATNKVGELVVSVPGKIQEMANAVPSILAGFATSSIGFFIDMVSDSTDEVGKLITQIPGKLLEMASAAYTELTTWVTSAVALIKTLPGMALTALGELGSVLLQAGRDLVQGFINGILEMVPDVLGAAGEVAGAAIDTITSFGRSPWPATIKAGQDFSTGFAVGIRRGEPNVIQAATTLGSVGVAALGRNRRTRDDAVQAGQELGNNFVQGAGFSVDAGLQGIGTRIGEGWDAILSQTSDILSGQAMVQLSEQVRNLQQQLDLARLLGAPEDIIAGLQASLAAAESQLDLLSDIQRKAIEEGLVGAWDNIDLDALAGEVGNILSGDYQKQLQKELDKINQVIAFGTAEGWSEELLAKYRAMAEETGAELAEVNERMALAAAEGLLTDEALAEWERSLGVLAEVPIDALVELAGQMADGGTEIVDQLTQALLDGQIGIEEAFDAFNRISDQSLSDLVETNDLAMADLIEDMQAVEQQLLGELAQALVDGTDPAGIKANIEAIQALLQQLQEEAAETAEALASMNPLDKPQETGTPSTGGGHVVAMQAPPGYQLPMGTNAYGAPVVINNITVELDSNPIAATITQQSVDAAGVPLVQV